MGTLAFTEKRARAQYGARVRSVRARRAHMYASGAIYSSSEQIYRHGNLQNLPEPSEQKSGERAIWYWYEMVTQIMLRPHEGK